MNTNGYQQHFKKIKQSQQTVSDAQYNKIAQNLQKRTQVKRAEKVKRKFPLVQFLVFAICLVGLFFAVENFDELETKIMNFDISIGLSQAEASKAEEANKDKASENKATEDHKDAKSDKQAEASPEHKTTLIAQNKEATDEDYLFKLNERKKSLDQREEDLNKREKEIEDQKKGLEAKIKELEEYRDKISSMLQERVKADSAKIDTLVQLYSNMRPNQAAKVFETMEEDLVIEILTKMKRKTAADIMNLMKPEKAQSFAEKYSGYRVPASQLPKVDDKANSKKEISGDQIPENNSNTKQKEDSAR